MPLVTRNVSNVGDPFCSPDGTALAGKTITYTLVTAAGVATDIFDTATGERVVGVVTALTDSIGEFTVALWPNDRNIATVTKYLCHTDVPGTLDFKVSIASGATTLAWSANREY